MTEIPHESRQIPIPGGNTQMMPSAGGFITDMARQAAWMAAGGQGPVQMAPQFYPGMSPYDALMTQTQRQLEMQQLQQMTMQSYNQFNLPAMVNQVAMQNPVASGFLFGGDVMTPGMEMALSGGMLWKGGNATDGIEFVNDLNSRSVLPDGRDNKAFTRGFSRAEVSDLGSALMRSGRYYASERTDTMGFNPDLADVVLNQKFGRTDNDQRLDDVQSMTAMLGSARQVFGDASMEELMAKTLAFSGDDLAKINPEEIKTRMDKFAALGKKFVDVGQEAILKALDDNLTVLSDPSVAASMGIGSQHEAAQVAHDATTAGLTNYRVLTERGIIDKSPESLRRVQAEVLDRTQRQRSTGMGALFQAANLVGEMTGHTEIADELDRLVKTGASNLDIQKAYTTLMAGAGMRPEDAERLGSDPDALARHKKDLIARYEARPDLLELADGYEPGDTVTSYVERKFKTASDRAGSQFNLQEQTETTEDAAASGSGRALALARQLAKDTGLSMGPVTAEQHRANLRGALAAANPDDAVAGLALSMLDSGADIADVRSTARQSDAWESISKQEKVLRESGQADALMQQAMEPDTDVVKMFAMARGSLTSEERTNIQRAIDAKDYTGAKKLLQEAVANIKDAGVRDKLNVALRGVETAHQDRVRNGGKGIDSALDTAEEPVRMNPATGDTADPAAIAARNPKQGPVEQEQARKDSREVSDGDRADVMEEAVEEHGADLDLSSEARAADRSWADKIKDLFSLGPKVIAHPGQAAEAVLNLLDADAVPLPTPESKTDAAMEDAASARTGQGSMTQNVNITGGTLRITGLPVNGEAVAVVEPSPAATAAATENA